MRRHIEYKNLILFIKILKSSTIVASVAIENKEALLTLYIIFSISIEMLDLFKANLIVGLAILIYCNTLVIQQVIIDILDSLVKLCFQNNQHWKHPALCIDSINNSYLFSIPQLYSLYIAPFLSPYNNFYNYNNPYLETNLIKVIEIVIKYPIFLNYILYKIKLTLYNNQVLILYLLIVIFPVIYSIKLREALDKVYKLVFANNRQ